MFLVPRCWHVGYFFICRVASTLVFIPSGVYLVFLRHSVVCLSFWWSYYAFWCHCVSCPFRAVLLGGEVVKLTYDSDIA
jgi:hypothetical protein